MTKLKLKRNGYELTKDETRDLKTLSENNGYKGKLKPYVEDLLRRKIKENKSLPKI